MCTYDIENGYMYICIYTYMYMYTHTQTYSDFQVAHKERKVHLALEMVGRLENSVHGTWAFVDMYIYI